MRGPTHSLFRLVRLPKLQMRADESERVIADGRGSQLRTFDHLSIEFFEA